MARNTLKVPRALTIAGSDSGGGAGIQADLKAFAALGVHGMSAITAVTAQNTMGVEAIQDISVEIIRAQIRAVVDDIGVDAVKTGMLHTNSIIEVVADELGSRFPLVVDPVMVAKSGATLLKQDAVKSIVDKMLPLAAVVTPNAPEAEVLSNIRVKSVEDAKKAAKKIANYGPKAVVVKGGHIDTADKVVDLLYYDGVFKIFESQRLHSKCTHGTGCTFASAIAAGLAKGQNIIDAVEAARNLVWQAIKYGYAVGGGHGPVNPLATLYLDAERQAVLSNLKQAVAVLEEHGDVSQLIPESQSNIGMALSRADLLSDVAAIPGRIVRIGSRVKSSSCPEFGASSHIANTVLVALKHDPEMKAAMNVKYSPKLVETCREMGLLVSSYDRSKEPPEIKRVEGRTTQWGAEEAIRSVGKVPDVIYHTGDMGKEPMIVLLGRDALTVARKVVELARESKKHQT